MVTQKGNHFFYSSESNRVSIYKKSGLSPDNPIFT